MTLPRKPGTKVARAASGWRRQARIVTAKGTVVRRRWWLGGRFDDDIEACIRETQRKVKPSPSRALIVAVAMREFFGLKGERLDD